MPLIYSTALKYPFAGIHVELEAPDKASVFTSLQQPRAKSSMLNASTQTLLWTPAHMLECVSFGAHTGKVSKGRNVVFASAYACVDCESALSLSMAIS